VRARWLGLAVIVVAGAALLLRHCVVADGDRATPGSATPAPAAGAAAPRSPRVPILALSAAEPGRQQPPPTTPFDGTKAHTADPCTAPVEPSIPGDFQSITFDGITVAWNPGELTGPGDVPLRPALIARLAAGMLEDAAELTGTPRRAEVTIVVDATRPDFQARMHAPAWVGGLYDGSAVQLYARLGEELGVSLAALRHELMHAQLHAAVGCMPFWLNEGLAQYVEGAVPTRDWMTMLRTSEPFDLATLGAPVVFDIPQANVMRMYSVSLAMIVALTEHGGELALRNLVRVAASVDSARTAVELWDRVAPRTGFPALLDILGRKVFGVPTGAELETLLRGPLCCSGTRSPSDFTCHATAAHPEDRPWIDYTTTPHGYCRNRWTN
jgi:hypothetical protein